MVRYFKVLSPLNNLFLALILVVLRIRCFFDAEILYDTSEFMLFVNRIGFLEPFSYVFTPVSLQVLSMVIVYSQALWINHIIYHTNLFNKPTQLPALIYVILSSFFMPFLGFKIAVVQNFFVIYLIKRTIDLYRQSSVQMVMFDIGLVVAFGTYVYPPFISAFLVAIIALSVFRPFNWREWIAVPAGIVTIFILVYTYHFLHSDVVSFTKSLPYLHLGEREVIHLDLADISKVSTLLIVSIVASIKLREKFFSSFILLRKFFQVNYVFIVVLGMAFLFKKTGSFNHFVMCVPSFSILFAYYFLFSERKWLHGILFWAMIGCIAYFDYFEPFV